MGDTQDRYRLPRSVTPVRYDLTFTPDLEAATYTGSQDITVDVHEAVAAISLNALELEIDPGELRASGGHRIAVTPRRSR